jgi:Putative phage metallopeptidase
MLKSLPLTPHTSHFTVSMSTLNLTLELERLIADVALRMEEFSHIDPERVMVCVSSTRGGGIHGTYAKIHPLRFEGGNRTTMVRRRRGRHLCEITPIACGGVDMLYLIYFLVPRFLNLPFREKLITLFHELHHISPDFNGDIRRFPGKNYAHGSSRKKFNASMEKLVGCYLEKIDDAGSLEFLDGDMEALRSRYGSIVGRKMAVPRLRLVDQERTGAPCR